MPRLACVVVGLAIQPLLAGAAPASANMVCDAQPGYFGYLHVTGDGITLISCIQDE